MAESKGVYSTGMAYERIERLSGFCIPNPYRVIRFFSGKKAEEAPSTNAIDVTIPVPDLGDKEEGNNP